MPLVPVHSQATPVLQPELIPPIQHSVPSMHSRGQTRLPGAAGRHAWQIRAPRSALCWLHRLSATPRFETAQRWVDTAPKWGKPAQSWSTSRQAPSDGRIRRESRESMLPSATPAPLASPAPSPPLPPVLPPRRRPHRRGPQRRRCRRRNGHPSSAPPAAVAAAHPTACLVQLRPRRRRQPTARSPPAFPAARRGCRPTRRPTGRPRPAGDVGRQVLGPERGRRHRRGQHARVHPQEHAGATACASGAIGVPEIRGWLGDRRPAGRSRFGGRRLLPLCLIGALSPMLCDSCPGRPAGARTRSGGWRGRRRRTVAPRSRPQPGLLWKQARLAARPTAQLRRRRRPRRWPSKARAAHRRRPLGRGVLGLQTESAPLPPARDDEPQLARCRADSRTGEDLVESNGPSRLACGQESGATRQVGLIL